MALLSDYYLRTICPRMAVSSTTMGRTEIMITLTKTHRQRLTKLIFLLLTMTIISALVLYALKQNINLYYTPSELTEDTPAHRQIRVGGLVKPGSVQYGEDLKVRFILTDHIDETPVVFEGILPDLFREGQGIITLGHWSKAFGMHADNVLAKHDENYQPPRIMVSHAVDL